MEDNIYYSVECEKIVLGSLLLNPISGIESIYNKIHSDDFYDPFNRMIYEKIMEMYNDEKKIEAASLGVELHETDQYKKNNGTIYIAQLMENTTFTNLEYYADVIKQKSRYRHLYTLADGIKKRIHDREDVEAIATYTDIEINNIIQEKGDSTQELSEIVLDTIDKVEERYKMKEKGLSVGLSTGFNGLDKMTNGFHPNSLIIIGARPSMGKTAYALNLADNLCKINNASGLIFSLEMTKNQLVERMISTARRINSIKMRSGYLKESEWKKVFSYGKLVKERSGKLYINDDPDTSIIDIRATARIYKKKYGIDFVMIDYLQIMKVGRGERRHEIGKITRGLKKLSKELEIPVILLSQLSRDNEKRSNKKPFLSDLKESGDIEQDADLVIFLHRDDYYEDKIEGQLDEENEGTPAEAIMAKNRNGSVGVVKMKYFRNFTSFVEAI